MTATALSIDLVRSILSYDPETGIFRWKVARSNRVKVGDIATRVCPPKGYLKVSINKKRYLAHRLAWFYVYGVWPENEIDHRNLIKSDNRLDNLREATPSQNKMNTRLYRNNTSGHRGVYFNKRRGKWVARITTAGKTKSLGYHDVKEAAIAAYALASANQHQNFSRL